MMRPIYQLKRSGGTTGGATTDFFQAEPDNVGDCPVCEACGGAIGSLRWEPPFLVEIETWGNQFGDLAFGPGDSFLVSEHFKVSWEHDQLVGLEGFEPVEIVMVRYRRGRIRKAPPRYFCVWAIHSPIAWDPEASGVVWSTPPQCNVCLDGIADGWDRVVLRGDPSEDIFIARGHAGQLLVSERFKRFCEEHAISNCRLIPAEQAGHWFGAGLPWPCETR